MRMLMDKKAVSTFILIILMLCSAVFGGIIAYLGVIANYYNMPENTTFLIVEDAVFPVYDAAYFNVTILNPSNSASDINITAIRVSVEGKDQTYNVTATEPELSLLGRGTRQTFKCKENWSSFAGETVRIEPVAANASIKSQLYTTPNVKLKITPVFDPSISMEYFNVTVENPAESIINLTISDIELFDTSLKANVTPSLNYVLPRNTTESFRVDYNWEDLRWRNVTTTVKTVEGYEAVFTTNELLGVILTIDEVKFDYMDTTYFNVTIASLPDSTTTASISKMNLTLQEGNTVVINETSPQIGSLSVDNSVPQNTSKTFTCFWNWTTYRDKNVTVNVYTNEDFDIPSETVQTPSAIIWNVTELKFDLDDTDRFLVNVTNSKASLSNITITEIRLNQTTVTMNQTVLQPDEQKVIICLFDWKNFIGKNVSLTIFREGGANISKTLEISPVGLKILGDSLIVGDLRQQYTNITIPLPILYFNLTIANSNNSLKNVTIIRITLETGNQTFEIEYNLTYPKLGPNGYVLKIGETITFMCEWDWTRYMTGAPIKIIVYTEEGYQASKTF